MGMIEYSKVVIFQVGEEDMVEERVGDLLESNLRVLEEGLRGGGIRITADLDWTTFPVPF